MHVVAKMVPRGLEPRTLRLLAVRSNQLSYETLGRVLRNACSALVQGELLSFAFLNATHKASISRGCRMPMAPPCEGIGHGHADSTSQHWAALSLAATGLQET